VQDQAHILQHQAFGKVGKINQLTNNVANQLMNGGLRGMSALAVDCVAKLDFF
jgi:hypothetical protein